MESLNYPRLSLASFITAGIFIIAELIIEGAASVLFGISEEQSLRGVAVPTGGPLYHVITLIYLYGFCYAAMWLYASLIPQYRSLTQSAVAAYLFMMFLILLAVINTVNIGLAPMNAGVISLLFTFTETFPAIMIDAVFYSLKQQTAGMS